MKVKYRANARAEGVIISRLRGGLYRSCPSPGCLPFSRLPALLQAACPSPGCLPFSRLPALLQAACSSPGCLLFSRLPALLQAACSSPGCLLFSLPLAWPLYRYRREEGGWVGARGGVRPEGDREGRSAEE